jgi:hypothetical protein
MQDGMDDLGLAAGVICAVVLVIAGGGVWWFLF